MDNHSHRKYIFKEELGKLKEQALISPEDYEKISHAHNTYYSTMYPRKDTLQAKGEDGRKPEKPQSHKSGIPPKKTLPPQDIRERNITWVLILGVIMILLSALILATSNWDVMNDITKTVLIGLVAVLFFGVSRVSEKWLKIVKTSYAFWVLGSLFIPVAIISAGFFNLFGSWLSIQGEGRYVLGIMGSLLCLPVYGASACKYKSRLFAWLSLFSLSACNSFLIASFNPSTDLFYFGIILYNGLMILAYIKFKEGTKLKLIVNELLLFIQVNLIISTLFMLFYFNDYRFYGANMIFAAILYSFLIFSQGSRAYSFIFSGLLVYGIYQVVTHTGAASLDIVLFSLIGFIFLGMEFALKDNEKQIKAFHYISGFVSFMAFIFIIATAMQIETRKPSLMLAASFFIIGVNYAYLAYKAQKWVYRYLAPVFIVLAGHHVYSSIQLIWNQYLYSVHIFLTALIVFMGLYYFNRSPMIQQIRRSSGIVSLLVMLYAVLNAIDNGQAVISFVLLHALGLALYAAWRHTKNESFIRKAVKYAIPILWFSGMMMLFPEIEALAYSHNMSYVLPVHFALCAYLIYGWSLLWRKMDNRMEIPFFWAGHALIVMGILSVQAQYGNLKYIPLIYAGALGIYICSFLMSNTEWKKRMFLYGSFALSSLILASIFNVFEFNDVWKAYVMLISSIVLFIPWLLLNDTWKKRIVWYLIPFSIIGIISMIEGTTYIMRDFWFIIAYISLVLYLNHRSRIHILNFLPLSLFMLNIGAVQYQVFQHNGDNMIITLLAAFFVLNAAGLALYKGIYLYKRDESEPVWISIDWYTIFALPCLIWLFNYIGLNSNMFLHLVPYVLLTGWLVLQSRRVGEGIIKKIAITVAALSILLPYYNVLLNRINVYPLIQTELKLLPWIILAPVLTKITWKEYGAVGRKIELLVLLSIFAILFRDLIIHANVYDGLILGVLSLVYVIAGMQFRLKSYFFTGIGSMMLVIFLLTLDFWQSIPWWGYLLAAGIILIITASVSEMQKNRKEGTSPDKGRKTIMNKFDKWEL